MAKKGKKRTADQRRRDLALTADLYLKGKTQNEIADTLGFTRQQISYDLAVVRKQWLQSSVRDFDDAKALELAKLNRLEREYWDEWEESRSPVQTR